MTESKRDYVTPAKRRLDEIRLVDRHRVDLGDLAGLAASIATEGLLHPIVVTADGRLIAGARRLAAVRVLGWGDVPVTVVGDVEDAAALLRMERDENECRKEMTPSERVSLGRALEELERPKAKAAQVEGARQGAAITNGAPSVPTNGRRDAYDVREVVAPAVGMSTATYSRAKQLVTAAEGGDQRAAEAVAQMNRTGKVTPAYEDWRGEPVNRGADAPTTRDAYELGRDAMPEPPKASPVKNFKGNPAIRAVPKSLATLDGLAHALSTITASDLAAVSPEVRAQWSADLTSILSSLRCTRDRMKGNGS